MIEKKITKKQNKTTTISKIRNERIKTIRDKFRNDKKEKRTSDKYKIKQQ